MLEQEMTLSEKLDKLLWEQMDDLVERGFQLPFVAACFAFNGAAFMFRVTEDNDNEPLFQNGDDLLLPVVFVVLDVNGNSSSCVLRSDGTHTWH